MRGRLASRSPTALAASVRHLLPRPSATGERTASSAPLPARQATPDPPHQPLPPTSSISFKNRPIGPSGALELGALARSRSHLIIRHDRRLPLLPDQLQRAHHIRGRRRPVQNVRRGRALRVEEPRERPRYPDTVEDVARNLLDPVVPDCGTVGLPDAVGHLVGLQRQTILSVKCVPWNSSCGAGG